MSTSGHRESVDPSSTATGVFEREVAGSEWPPQAAQLGGEDHGARETSVAARQPVAAPVPARIKPAVLVGAIIAVVLLGVFALGGGDEEAGDQVTAADPGGAAQVQSTDPTGNGIGDFQTIWPVPDVGQASIDPNFGKYTIIDDDFQFTESVTFEVVGADLDSVVAFYEVLLPNLGYTVGRPVTAGESVFWSLSVPDEPNTSGVVQAGPSSPTDPTIIVHQQQVVLKSQPEPDTDDDGPASVEAKTQAEADT